MTALAAAAEQTTMEGKDSASLANASRSFASMTNNGFSLSDPCGLIILLSFSVFT
jgi:hypothetical protein